MRRIWTSSVVAGCLLAPLALSPAHAQSDYYKGKTISIVIGAKGGSLTLAGQIVAQLLGRYIPGNPTVIFRQMPGGARLRAHRARAGRAHHIGGQSRRRPAAARRPAASPLRRREIRMARLVG